MLGFWEMQRKGKNSLRNWAIECGILLNDSISKQGIDNRLNDNCLTMMELIFKRALNLKYTKVKKELKGRADLQEVSVLFNRILLHPR